MQNYLILRPEFRMKKKHFNIPVFIPELGCPFQCIYCNQKKICGKKHIPLPDEINNWIELNLQTIPWRTAEVQLAFFGGNFTGLPVEQQVTYLKIAEPFIRAGKISGIRLSTRPDYINNEILGLLKEHHVTSIELGAQSMDDEVLKHSQRGNTVADTENAAKMIRDQGFSLGLQMMIGLPGDTFEKSLSTAKKIIELGAEETRIYPTLVIQGTQLEALFQQGKYKPLTLEEAVAWSARLVSLFDYHGVKVLKVGLHPSEGLLDGTELVAGPFHPLFRQLVLTEIWSQIFQPLFLKKGSSLAIEVSEQEINHAIGYKSQNKKALLKNYEQVRFTTNALLKGRNHKMGIAV
jgi:histone acetyltransferase (RNA polymerase elongator complex component)